MTCIGVSKTRDGCAYVWSDSDVYRDGAVVREMVKLGASSAGVVGVSTGYADLAGRFCDRIKGLGRASIGATIAALPAQLRAVHAAKVKHAGDYEYQYEAQSSYAVVGWDGVEIRAAVFRESRNFEPLEVDAFWTSPNVNLTPPSTASEVHELACAQVRFLQIKNRGAGANGMLDIAKIGADRVATTRVKLLI